MRVTVYNEKTYNTTLGEAAASATNFPMVNVKGRSGVWLVRGHEPGCEDKVNCIRMDEDGETGQFLSSNPAKLLSAELIVRGSIE